MSGQIDLLSGPNLGVNQAVVIGNGQLQPDALQARRGQAQPAAESSIFSYNPCSCVWELGSLIWRGFRACVAGIARCIISCCCCCLPARRPRGAQAERRDPQPNGVVQAQRRAPQPRINHITVGEFLALANRNEPRATIVELNAAFGRLSNLVREHVYARITERHQREIEELASRYRREERKGAVLENREVEEGRAISEFIQNNPRHPTIVLALDELSSGLHLFLVLF